MSMKYTMQNKPQSGMTATPSKYPQGKFKVKPCKTCGVSFEPNAPSHGYCSQECADEGLTNKYLQRTYGITVNTYKSMLKEQNSKCKCCGGEGWTMAKHHKVKLVVDHCHETGVVRGLLCHNCNRALGLFKDSLTTIKNAYQYLESVTTIPKGSRLK